MKNENAKRKGLIAAIIAVAAVAVVAVVAVSVGGGSNDPFVVPTGLSAGKAAVKSSKTEKTTGVFETGDPQTPVMERETYEVDGVTYHVPTGDEDLTKMTAAEITDLYYYLTPYRDLTVTEPKLMDFNWAFDVDFNGVMDYGKPLGYTELIPGKWEAMIYLPKNATKDGESFRIMEAIVGFADVSLEDNNDVNINITCTKAGYQKKSEIKNSFDDFLIYTSKYRGDVSKVKGKLGNGTITIPSAGSYTGKATQYFLCAGGEFMIFSMEYDKDPSFNGYMILQRF